jgi:hypothetical protein
MIELLDEVDVTLRGRLDARDSDNAAKMQLRVEL